MRSNSYFSLAVGLCAVGLCVSACGNPAQMDASTPTDRDVFTDVTGLPPPQDSGVTTVIDGDVIMINPTDTPNPVTDLGPLADGAIQCAAPTSARCANICVDLQSDSNHCGACGMACSALANAAPSCSMGSCGLGACNAGFGNCDNDRMNGCETNTSNNINHCGACGMVCSAIANGTAQCNSGMCSVQCNMGFEMLGGRCVVTGSAPRPVSPVSLGDVTLRRPTLRWVLSGGLDGATVELCRDRACTMIIETLRVTGTFARPTNALPARSVVFWRMRGRGGMAESMTQSPTWLFHTPAVDGSSGVDSTSHPHVDVNGDGFDDVIAGGPSATRAGRTNSGMVNVYHGGVMGTGAAPNTVLVGQAASEFFGEPVAGAGDINGDGYGDVLVGSPYYSAPGRSETGRVQIYLGSAMGVAAAPARTMEGGVVSEHFGISLAGAGDVNGDGYADVIIGARDASPGGRARAGTVSIYLGSSAGLGAMPARQFEGASAGDQAGAAVAAAGDLNGDGFGDIVFGTTDGDPMGRPNTGTASVYLGSAMGIGAVAARVLVDETLSSRDFGIAVADAGDVNGDGYSDLVIGDNGATVAGRTYNGIASIFLGGMMGVPMTASRVLQGNAANSLFGQSVASAGDLNGDGFGDLVVGAPTAAPVGRGDAGIAYVYHGSVMGIGAATARVLEGVAMTDQFGASVAGGRDVNGDGFGDLVVGARLATIAGRLYTGSVGVYHGSAMGIATVPTRFYEGMLARDYLGAAVAMLDWGWRNANITGSPVEPLCIDRAI